MPREPHESLNLRFYEPEKPRAHSVPAIALSQSLEALQRVVHLLAMRREGHAPGRRLRPSAELQTRYQLVCDLPTDGSYMAPVRVEGAGLLGASEIPLLVKELCGLLSAIGNASEPDLEISIADETWRRFALEALERLAPPRATGVELEILVNSTPLMDTVKARPFIERIMRAPTRHRAPGVVIGEFKRIDFMKREITIRHLKTARDLSGVYSDYVEENLLEHPRATILVYGTIVRNAQGRPTSIDHVERIEAVDLDPVSIRDFVVGNVKVLALQELTAIISFDESELLFTAEIPSLRLSVHSESRALLDDAITDELELLWKRYAKAPDDTLTRAAQVLKGRLLVAFEESTADAP